MLRSRSLPTLITAVIVACCAAVPAVASEGSVPLPEPSAMLLLGLGVAGVAIGRRFSTKRPRD